MYPASDDVLPESGTLAADWPTAEEEPVVAPVDEPVVAPVEPSPAAPTPPPPPAPAADRINVRVGIFVTGKGYVRPNTYFALTVETGAAAARGRVVWYNGSYTYRRYSEVVLLRRYLVLCFPAMIVPPLPPKSAMESMKTSLAFSDTLDRQKEYLAHFFLHLGRHQQLFANNFLVQQFMQLNRDDNNLEDERREKTGTVPEGTVPPSMGSLTATIADIQSQVANKESTIGLRAAQAAAAAPVGFLLRSAASWWGGGDAAAAQAAPSEQQLRSFLDGTPFTELLLRRAAWDEHRRSVEAAAAEAWRAHELLSSLIEAERGQIDGIAALAAALTANSEQEAGDAFCHLSDTAGTNRAVSHAVLSSIASLHGALLFTVAYDGAVTEALDLGLDQWRAWAGRNINPVDRPAARDREALHTRRLELVELSLGLHSAVAQYQRDAAARLAEVSLAPGHRDARGFMRPNIIGACERALTKLSNAPGNPS